MRNTTVAAAAADWNLICYTTKRESKYTLCFWCTYRCTMTNRYLSLGIIDKCGQNTHTLFPTPCLARTQSRQLHCPHILANTLTHTHTLAHNGSPMNISTMERALTSGIGTDMRIRGFSLWFRHRWNFRENCLWWHRRPFHRPLLVRFRTSTRTAF